MEEIEYKVVIDHDLDEKVRGVVAFGTFTTDDQTLLTAIYPDGGVELFYRDLILGRPFPFTLVTRGVESLGTVMGIALFLRRDLALQPKMRELCSSACLVDLYGVAGEAHTDSWDVRLFRAIRRLLGSARGKKAQQDALKIVLDWIQEVVGGAYPQVLDTAPEPPRVLERGTDGFVLAHSSHSDLEQGWEFLYRSGFLRGLLLARASEDRWFVLGARKSPYVPLDLGKAAQALNEAEQALGDGKWEADTHWLRGPKGGTLLLPSAILNLMLRL